MERRKEKEREIKKKNIKQHSEHTTKIRPVQMSEQVNRPCKI